MSKPYPEEFHNDVAAVARRSEAPLSLIANDFRIGYQTLLNWLKCAYVKDGVRPDLQAAQS